MKPDFSIAEFLGNGKDKLDGFLEMAKDSVVGASVNQRWIKENNEELPLQETYIKDSPEKVDFKEEFDNLHKYKESKDRCENKEIKTTLVSKRLKETKRKPRRYKDEFEHFDEIEKEHPQCPQCQKYFSDAKATRKHIKMVHDKIKDNKCSQCPYSAFQRYALKRHINIVHKKSINYFCDDCEYKSGVKGNLKSHIANVHGTKLAK